MLPKSTAVWGLRIQGWSFIICHITLWETNISIISIENGPFMVDIPTKSGDFPKCWFTRGWRFSNCSSSASICFNPHAMVCWCSRWFCRESPHAPIQQILLLGKLDITIQKIWLIAIYKIWIITILSYFFYGLSRILDYNHKKKKTR